MYSVLWSICLIVRGIFAGMTMYCLMESYCKSLTGIPRKYLPVIMLITVPVGIWILMIIGILFSGYRIISRKLIQRKKDYIIAVSVIGIAPLGYAVFSATPVYNGWRHFYFVYASIIIFVACAVYYFLEISAKKKIFNMVFCGYIAWLLLGIIVNHPYEYAYYNCLAGNNVEQRYELDYWDMSFKQALEKIAQNDDRSRIGIATCDNPSNWGISAQMCAIRGKYRCRFVTDVSFEEADYIIVNPTYFALYSYEYYEKIQEEFIVVDKMKSYGKTICYI